VHPILFELDIFGFPITLYSFGLVIVLAFLVASWYVRRRASKRLGLDRERVFNVCFALLFLGILGARLLHVFVDYETYVKKPLSFLQIWDGGLSFYGGLIACLLWLAWWLPRHPDLGGFSLVDVLALGGSLAVAVGSWGSFLSGDSYGKPAGDLAWGVTFPYEQKTAAPRGEALHPTQIYHSLHGFLVFGLLLLYLRRRPAPGRATGLFLMLYAAGRAVIELYRGDEARGMVIEDVLSVPQMLSIPTFFAGLAILLIRRTGTAPAAASA
jgi:phosphatidylglycerol:prolipoprotein diacylglycerol transferase